jgi:stress-induced morphogen
MSLENAEQVAQPEATPAPAIETPAEVASGGSGNEFLNMIPEDLREHPSLSPIKDVQNLARSYVNSQKLIGADKLPLPANPTDEDLDRIADRLGRPEAASGYEIAVDGSIITEEVAQDFAEMAHKARLTPKQVVDVLDYYKDRVQGTAQADADKKHQSQIDASNQLKAEWGSNYDKHFELAMSLADELSDKQAITRIVLQDGTNLGDHPEFIKAFAKFAEFKQSVTSEDTVAEKSQVNHMTKQSAQAEIDAIMKSPEYTGKDAVARDRAVQRVAELMVIVHG